ncbi:MAG: hypothetical protein ACT4NX_02030 [Deltaproteobacteria bacterium]
MDESTDKIAQFIIVNLIFGVLGFIATIVTLSLAGPCLPGLLQQLPW